jgi:thymidylate synthase (FAD)
MVNKKAIEYYKSIAIINVLRCTENPLNLLNRVLSNSIKGNSTEDRINSVIKKGHTSFLEFIDMTIEVHPVTKAFLGQVTRHRMASYMSSSYHYTKAKKGNWVLPYVDQDFRKPIMEAFDRTEELYQKLLEIGVEKEEARNILPGAMGHSLIMKINGRSLFNFFNLRLCYRNIPEMVAIAELLYNECMRWCPEVFSKIGPDCIMGKCKQGTMYCGRYE